MVILSSCFLSVLISLTSVPLVIFITDHDVFSDPLLLMVVGFSFLAFVGIIIKTLLPPKTNVKSEHSEGRGLLYYTCCVFMWASIADLTLQSRAFHLFGKGSNSRYFEHGEAYLKVPFGITTQFWNAIVHYVLFLKIIYEIDNNQDCRNTTLYWCGSIMTSQFVVLVGTLSGSFSDKLEYSAWMNVIFLALPAWVFYKFLVKPITVKHLNKSKEISSIGTLYDAILCMLLLVLSVFALMRGLGALGSRFPVIKWYVDNCEPYIKDPANFGSSWVLYTAIYGIPFQFCAIYGLIKPGCQWMLNLCVFYAAGMLQGTFTYLSYSWYPSAEKQYIIPQNQFYFVVSINVLLVVTAHLLMHRCLTCSSFFLDSQKSSKILKKKH